MSLHVLNAHTGQQYDADLASLAALEDLKSWLGQVSGVSPAQQILLTGEGKQVKLQALRDRVSRSGNLYAETLM
jgi:autophagy-related protein 11